MGEVEALRTPSHCLHTRYRVLRQAPKFTGENEDIRISGRGGKHMGVMLFKMCRWEK